MKSGARMIALDTARFTLEHEGEGSSQLLPGLELKRVEGQVDMPGRYKIRGEATVVLSQAARAFTELNVVVVEDQAFSTDLITGKWTDIPVGTLPFNFADLGRTLSAIISSLEEHVYNGTEVVDGVLSWRIKGIVPSESLATPIPKSAPGRRMGLKSWIGQAEGLRSGKSE